VKQTRPKKINEKFRGKSGSNYKYICSYNFNTARTAVTASTFKATKEYDICHHSQVFFPFSTI
jgi:hypothetical protein